MITSFVRLVLSTTGETRVTVAEKITFEYASKVMFALSPVLRTATYRSGMSAVTWRLSTSPIVVTVLLVVTFVPVFKGDVVIVPLIGAYTALCAYVSPGVEGSTSAIT